MKKILFLLLFTQMMAYSQKIELRPEALVSFHNIAKVPAFGLRLEANTRLKGSHFIFSGFEYLHGEGNQGFQIGKDGFYSYRFDNEPTNHTSAWAYLYENPLNVKSAKLSLAAAKIGYQCSITHKKNQVELNLAAYGNYVGGFYVLEVLENVPNYNPDGDNIEFFVVQYFFNYFDIGPSVSARYIFHTKSKVDPVVGLDYNYGKQKGSWATVSIGLKLK